MVTAVNYGLAGMVAVVTGAAGDLGRAIAGRLQMSGARVALWDMRDDYPVEAEQLACAVDVTDEVSIEAAIARTRSSLGEISILVNGAGILGPVEEIANYSTQSWRRVIDVNLTGTFLCARAVVHGMRTRGYGRIVNIASLQGKEGTALAGAYAASKAAVIALTKTLGRELAQSGVLVNCVTPTAIDAGMTREIAEARRADTLSRIPMGRLGEAREVAAMVAWLCSRECSYSTGAAFDLSGGRASY